MSNTIVNKFNSFFLQNKTFCTEFTNSILHISRHRIYQQTTELIRIFSYLLKNTVFVVFLN